MESSENRGTRALHYLPRAWQDDRDRSMLTAAIGYSLIVQSGLGVSVLPQRLSALKFLGF